MTRPEDHGGRLSALLRERGARPLPLPLTALAPPRDPGPLRSAARHIGSYHWIVVTSRNAVGFLVEAMEAEGTLEALTAARTMQRSDATRTGPRICAVGPGTAAALEEAGLAVDRTPKSEVAGYTAEGVVAALSDIADGLRILYPRAAGAREVIPRELGARGATVEAVEAYRTVDDREGARALVRGVDRGEVDVITFAAGSAARSFARAWGERAWPAAAGIVAIGPVTARALRAEGLPVHGTGEPHTLEGLVAAVEAWVLEREP